MQRISRRWALAGAPLAFVVALGASYHCSRAADFIGVGSALAVGILIIVGALAGVPLRSRWPAHAKGVGVVLAAIGASLFTLFFAGSNALSECGFD